MWGPVYKPSQEIIDNTANAVTELIEITANQSDCSFFTIIRSGTGNHDGNYKKIIVLDDIRFNDLYYGTPGQLNSYMAGGNLTNEFLPANIELKPPCGMYFTRINLEAGRILVEY